jgi:hypothetical protein
MQVVVVVAIGWKQFVPDYEAAQRTKISKLAGKYKSTMAVS